MLKDPKRPVIPGTSLMMCPEASADVCTQLKPKNMFIDGECLIVRTVRWYAKLPANQATVSSLLSEGGTTFLYLLKKCFSDYSKLKVAMTFISPYSSNRFIKAIDHVSL